METPERIKGILESELGHKVLDVLDYSDGFSFGCETELQAYKAAYRYRFTGRIEVKFAPNCGQWRVSIYLK